MENDLWGSLKNQVHKVKTFDILILYMQNYSLRLYLWRDLKLVISDCENM